MTGGAGKAIKVLVVDDSAIVRQVCSMVLASDKSLNIKVTTAPDPIFALNKMAAEPPDVIILDLEMPRMDGLTFLKKIMAERPVPVIICSGHTDNADLALRALEEGAVEIITKPKVGIQEFLVESAVSLVDAIRAAAQARLKTSASRAVAPAPKGRTASPVAKLSADAVLPPLPPRRAQTVAGERIVVIGASTGGTEALQSILSAMPPQAPGIAVVQHMPEGFTRAFADRLNQLCLIEVREARDGDELHRGLALIAPGNNHLIVRRSVNRCFVNVISGPLVSRHRPSVDVLFRSAAQSFGSNAVGVILTGMGDDGSQGLLEMKNSGAATIAQDEASSVVFGMPKEAITVGAVDEVVTLGLIPSAILKLAFARSTTARTARGN